MLRGLGTRRNVESTARLASGQDDQENEAPATTSAAGEMRNLRQVFRTRRLG